MPRCRPSPQRHRGAKLARGCQLELESLEAAASAPGKTEPPGQGCSSVPPARQPLLQLSEPQSLSRVVLVVLPWVIRPGLGHRVSGRHGAAATVLPAVMRPGLGRHVSR